MRSPAPIRSDSRETGIALIMVMLVTTVLGIVAAGFAYTMKVETKLARNATFDAEMLWAARSGVERARWYLAMPGGQGPLAQVDCLASPWAGGVGDTNNTAVLEFPLKGFQIGEATVDVTITDCDRKLNINTVDRVVLQEALTLIGVNDAAWAGTVIDSVVDWIDKDDSRNPSGAESDDYTSNPNPGYPPYVAKNGPINDMSEMLMIRGVTPALFWGSSAAGHWQPPRLRGAGSKFEEPSFPIGLVDIFTATSSGKLNVNTASRTTLQAIPGLDANMVEEMIIKARAGPDGVEGTEDDTPILNPGQIGFGMMPGMGPGARPPAGGASPGINPMASMANLFTTRSLIFEATVEVKVGGASRTYVALLRRNSPKDIQILNMYWK